MKINSIGAMSYNQTAHSIKPMAQNFGGTPKLHHAGKTMKALAAAAILGMAAVGMSSCVQPTDPTQIEIPEEKETPVDDEATTPVDDEDTDPIDDEETKPVVDDGDTDPIDDEETKPIVDDGDTDPIDDEETKPIVDDGDTDPIDDEETKPVVDDDETIKEDPTVEDPTIETPTVDIANAPIVNAIRELGFGIDIVDVEPVEGLYTPETGDLIDLKFTDYDVDIAMQMQLDREKSTKDNLVYKCVKSWDTLYDEDIDAQDLQDRYFSKMTFDKENHSVSFFYTDDDDNTEKRLMTIRIELDENNKASFIYNGIGNNYKDRAQEVDNGEVFKPPGITRYDEIEIQLAK